MQRKWQTFYLFENILILGSLHFKILLIQSRRWSFICETFPLHFLPEPVCPSARYKPLPGKTRRQWKETGSTYRKDPEVGKNNQWDSDHVQIYWLTWRFETESGAASVVPVSVLVSLPTLSCSTSIQWSISPDSFNCPIFVLNLQFKSL